MSNKSKISEHLKSFIPAGIEVFEEANTFIDFQGLDNTRGSKRLQTLNSVNNHMFKPRFYKKGGKLIIHAASPDIAQQTQEAIDIYRRELNLSQIVYNTNAAHNTQKKYHAILSTVELHRNVFIGQFYSVLDFFISLAISKYISPSTARTFIQLSNSSRIEKASKSQKHIPTTNKILSTLLSKSELSVVRKHLKVRNRIAHPFILSATIELDNQPITLIQSPWGESLARVLGDFLNMSKNVRNIYHVGGCAGLQENMHLEDVAFPSDYIAEGIQSTPSKLDTEVPQVDHLGYKVKGSINHAHKCSFYTVNSSLSTKGIREVLTKNGVGCIEMEYAYLAEATTSKNLFSAFYIMDLPNKGIGLSNTYYNYNFLVHLNRRTKRAKNFCYYTMYYNLINND